MTARWHDVAIPGSLAAGAVRRKRIDLPYGDWLAAMTAAGCILSTHPPQPERTSRRA